MKQLIIAVAALTACAGAAILFLSCRKHKSRMTFAELYEDNLCEDVGSLFD